MAIIVVLIVAATLTLPKVLAKNEVSTRIVTYNVVEVTYGNVSTTISGSGNLTPVSMETCSAEYNGEITAVNYAVGAKRRHILMQFLCESCVLSVLGGLIGLAMSFAGIYIYNMAAGTAIGMNWSIGAAAIAFCAVIGVLFGSYPAAKASKLQPIEALHAE